MQFNRIILDADSLVYRVGFAAEADPVSHACQSLKSQIKSIKQACECENMEVFISGTGNFREDVSTSVVYKGNRPQKKPKHYDDLRDYLLGVHSATIVDGMETDDMCSYLLYQAWKKGGEERSGTVLASMDKDLWNTPGWHFNYDPRKWHHDYVAMHEANINFLRQMLSGDRVDNIPGLPYCTEEIIEHYSLSSAAAKGCGIATAKKIIPMHAKVEDAMADIIRCYVSYGLINGWGITEVMDYIREQGRLLWMTREMENGKPVQWDIPKWASFEQAMKEEAFLNYLIEMLSLIERVNLPSKKESAHYV